MNMLVIAGSDMITIGRRYNAKVFSLSNRSSVCGCCNIVSTSRYGCCKQMAPAAVFALPFFQLYSAVGLFDTHLAVALAHCLFNIPLAVWILEGFMQGIPKELDETAFVDGYSFPRFFATIFIPTIKAGVGVAAFFCFMFSWVELLLAKTLTAVAAKPIAATMTKTASSAGYELGLLAAAGTLTIIPGAIVIYFVRNYIAKGFAMGRV